LQFVAGERNTYDRLCLEAYEPFLDLLLECPKWHADLEISGYMLDYIYKNFPFLHEKLLKLNKRKQLDIICVHYSESFYLAYPFYDFERSLNFCQEIMNKIGLEFSSTFFAQENCFGEGLSYIKDKFGIKTAIIPEKNYNWLYGKLHPFYPVYDLNGLNLIIRGEEWQTRYNGRFIFDKEGEDKKISWSYTKCGDGEPFLADDPYVNFKFNEKKWNEKLKFYDECIREGIQFTTTQEFVSEIEKLGISKPKLPPITDGPWGLGKPGVYQWMGFYFSFYELDAEIMSLNYRARTILLMAEFLLEYIKNQRICKECDEDFIKQLEYFIKRSWKFLAIAQVSDSTGWVPTLNEVWYSIDYALSAFYLGQKVIEQLIKRFELQIEIIDTYRKKFINHNEVEKCIKEDKLIRRVVSGQFIIDDKLREENVRDSRLRNACKEFIFENITPIINKEKISTEELSQLNLECLSSNKREEFIQLDENCWKYQVSFLQNDTKTGIRLNLLESRNLIYSPSLMDDRLIVHDYTKWIAPYLFLPLPNGLIYIGDGFWIIKHNDQNHVALKIDFEGKKLEFLLETNLMALAGREQLDIEVEQNWCFTIFKGNEKEALELANAINIFPIRHVKYPSWIYGNNILAPWTRFTRMVTK